MASFIPEWTGASGRELHIRRALVGLDDAYVIRRPLRQDDCAAAVFVQHATRGWLALAWSADPFAVLDPAQLFDSEPRQAFERLLDRLQALGCEPGTAGRGMAALVVMWGCTTEEAAVLQREHAASPGLHFISREQFAERGAELVSALLAPLSSAAGELLLGRHFPEVEIEAVCTTRRFAPRDAATGPPRFFLDPEQEWAVKLDLDLEPLPADQRETAGDFSVRLVNGVAGSGKTLIAIHRALMLAELFPRQHILVLIHNTPVVADIRERLRRARGGLPPNVEFMTFFSWMAEQWQRMFGAYPKLPVDPSEVPGLVAFHRRRWPELKASDAQLVAELDFIDDNLIDDEAAYAAASRAGRGFGLRGVERGQVWALHEAVTRTLRSNGMVGWNALPHAICRAGDRHGALQRYEHVLVDEAQFFAPSWFQAVKLSLAERGQLFMCADPNQGFMKNRLSWRSVGLEVAGRTKKLRRSYRTTRSILGAATAVLHLLGRQDPDDYLEPDFSGMPDGPRPLLLYARAPQDAVDRLVDGIAALAGERGVPLDAFLVIYGENVNKAALHGGLQRRFGAGRVWWFNERSQKKAPPRGADGASLLRMAYLDSATGLEAAVVMLVGMEGLLCFDPPADERTVQREEELRKLYMAMTRAGQRLVVLSCRRLAPAVERLFVVDEAGPLR